MVNKFIIDEDVARCLLCYDPPCKNECPAGKDPASLIMSLRFRNIHGATLQAIDQMKKNGECGKACNNTMQCQRSCIRGKIDRPIKIRMIQEYLCDIGQRLEEVKKIE